MQTHRCIIFLALITFAFLPLASSSESKTNLESDVPTKQATLALTNYDVAEVVFLRFLDDLMPKAVDTHTVRFLAYGLSDSDLPKDFMKRFQSLPVEITNASESEIRQVIRHGQRETILAERKKPREGSAVALRELTIIKDTAEAKVMTLHSGITIVTWKVRLKRDRKAWKVIEKIQVSIACSG